MVVGNGTGVQIKHIGSSLLHTPFHLHNILHSPNISPNLLSVRQFTKDNVVFFEFHHDGFVVKDRRTGTILHRGTIKDGLYLFESVRCPPSSPKPAFASSFLPLDVWHQQLGHPAYPIVSSVLNKHGFSFCKAQLNNVHVCSA